MLNHEEKEALARVAEHLVRHLATREPALCRDLQVLAEAFLRLTGAAPRAEPDVPPRPDTGPGPEPETVAVLPDGGPFVLSLHSSKLPQPEPADDDTPPPPVTLPPARPSAAPIVETVAAAPLDLGVLHDLQRVLASDKGSAPAAAPAPPKAFGWTSVGDDELDIIIDRCRLKSEACRWLAERLNQTKQSGPWDEPTRLAYEDLVRRGRAIPKCLLWMLHVRPHIIPQGPVTAEYLARAFTCMARGLTLVTQVMAQGNERPPEFLAVLELVAEAQAIARELIRELRTDADHDQEHAFFWLRRVTDEQGYYIRRYMRQEDKAGPDQLPSLEARLAEQETRYLQPQQANLIQQRIMRPLAYHLQQIKDKPQQPHGHDWKRVIELAGSWVEKGFPPSSPALREKLLSVMDEIPFTDDWPDSFRRVMRELDRFQAQRDQLEASQDSGHHDDLRVASPEVAQVRELLHGQSVVMVGGECRPKAHERLKAAFGLRELIWPNAPKDGSHTDYGPAIARPEVVVVIEAIRWSSHGFNEVKIFCDKYDKPLVRLKAGYHPNQVAVQVLSQCGDKLRSRLLAKI